MSAKTVEMHFFFEMCWILVLHHLGENAWRNLFIALMEALFRVSLTIKHCLPAVKEYVADDLIYIYIYIFFFTDVAEFGAGVLKLV